MKKTIVVIDGMGGGIGVTLINRIRELAESIGDTTGDTIEIIALGTNAVATERMVKAGAHRGATGENAIRLSASLGQYILGPIGIVIPNSMMGELTPAIAEAILAAPGKRILLPLENDHFRLVGLETLPLAKMVEKALDLLKEALVLP